MVQTIGHPHAEHAMTENCCYSHVTLNDHIKIDGGQGIALIAGKAEQNEILIKHDALMLGYYKEEQAQKPSKTAGCIPEMKEALVVRFLDYTRRVKLLKRQGKW